MRDERTPDYHFPPTTERQRENTRRYMALQKEKRAMTEMNRKAARYADKQVRKGNDMQAVAFSMLYAGIEMIRDGSGNPLAEAVVRIEGTGNPSITVPEPGHTVVIRPDRVTRLVGDDDTTAMYPPLTMTRIEELLDYATVYGAFDENTPNGTETALGSPMNEYRRGAIVLLKRILGFLPEDHTITMPDQDNYEALVDATSRSLTQFSLYADLHDAKGTPESREKADVNREFVQMCAAALGKRANFPPRTPQERDSGLPAPVEAPGARKASDAPLDRAEMLAILDMKIAGSTKAGMSDTASVLKALRGEIVQHLEAAPIDFAVALNAFYVDCHERNVKAGWWSDLATGQPKKRSVGELFILFVTELWEAYDAYVNGSMDDKLPEHPGIGVELGDLQIRLADFCGALAAGRIVEHTATRNPGDELFVEIGEIASRYERIRKTPEALGDVETGEPLDPMTVGEMVVEKLAFNAQRADHKPENRKLEGGKQT